MLEADLSRLGLFPDELYIDRGYINSSLAQKVAERGGEVVCKPWKGGNVKVGLFGKRDFKIHARREGGR